MEQDKMPEAVASISYSLVDTAGFPCIVTFRASTPKKLFAVIEEVREELVGYEPDMKYKAKDYTAKATQVKGDLDGDGATDAQKRVLIKYGKWEDGMSKSEASKIIGGLFDK
jgi:hypothetical protein